MKSDELREVLRLHALWRTGDHSGRRANLRGANLRYAYLRGANLRYAYLTDANLEGANLVGAYLRDAKLTGAKLTGAKLGYANLEGANLRGTVLDRTRMANGDVTGFERDGEHVIGYRTERSKYIGSTVYEPGMTYKAHVFSTCPSTECHPGLYLAPSVDATNLEGPHVKVRALATDVHHVGNKWRCRKFTVLERVV